MITVDAATYAVGLYAHFTNCTFTISGNFFYSALPIQLVFSNCTFNIANTTNLINLAYPATYCNTTDRYGDVRIFKSVF